MIRYGTNPIAWANDDDPALGGHIPTEQILADARDIGFDGMENGHRWPQDDPAALKALFDPYGLAYVSGWTSLNLLVHDVEAEKKAIQPALDKLKAHGSTICIACETSNSVQGLDCPVNDKPTLAPAAFQAFAERVEEIARYTAEQGIDLAYHPHMGTVVETPDEMDALMAATGPSLKLLFDSGHFYFGSDGMDPAPALKRYADRLAHFHAKNVRPDVMRRVRDENLSFMDGVRAGVFTVPGDEAGGIDFAPLLQVLKSVDYDRWIVIEAEQDPDVYDPMIYQSLGLKTLKALAADAGLA